MKEAFGKDMNAMTLKLDIIVEKNPPDLKDLPGFVEELVMEVCNGSVSDSCITIHAVPKTVSSSGKCISRTPDTLASTNRTETTKREMERTPLRTFS